MLTSTLSVASGTRKRPLDIPLGDYLRNDPPVDVGQPLVAAAVEVGQQRVVEPQQVQDRGVQVVDVDLVLDRGVADLVGRADDRARP